jgi:colanic acid biosynthesis glycosyl transferase WcaI
MAHVLLLTQVFPPDSVSTAQIMGDLAVDLMAEGHRVSVLTTSPHYNRDEDAEAEQPLIPYWGPVLRESEFHGATVFHTFMPQKSKGVWPRAAAWMGFHLISTLAGITVLREVDIIITPSPPLTIGASAWLLSVYHGCPYIYNVQEIYPDIAVKLGVLRDGFLLQMMKRLELFIYDHAAKVTVIAPHMRANLLGKGTPPEKVELIPNFVDTGDLVPSAKDNDFSRQYGLADRFVVSYAGNMGPAQGLDTLIGAAKILGGEDGIRFLLMGNGTLQDDLGAVIESNGLTNLVFLPYQPYRVMSMAYAASDLNLVPLAPLTGGDALPSKVYRIMACGQPVLAVAESGTDLAELVDTAGCGIFVESGSAERLAGAILDAYKGRYDLAAMGAAGRRCVEEDYSRRSVTGRYGALVRNLSAPPN